MIPADELADRFPNGECKYKFSKEEILQDRLERMEVALDNIIRKLKNEAKRHSNQVQKANPIPSPANRLYTRQRVFYPGKG